MRFFTIHNVDNLSDRVKHASLADATKTLRDHLGWKRLYMTDPEWQEGPKVDGMDADFFQHT